MSASTVIDDRVLIGNTTIHGAVYRYLPTPVLLYE